MQKRFWNFKDDDDTSSLRKWLINILPPGWYFGLDAMDANTEGVIFRNDLSLRLNHNTTGFTETNDDNTASVKKAKYIMPSGTVVSEDGVITLPVSANPSANWRYDLVVATEEYVEIEGGAEITYSIVQGTPSANPVFPNLPLPNNQIIIGYLKIAPTSTNLNGTARYERPSANLFLGRKPDNFAYLNKEQSWPLHQIFETIGFGAWKAATYTGPETSVPGMMSLAGAGNLFAYNHTSSRSVAAFDSSGIRGGQILFIQINTPVIFKPGDFILLPENKDYTALPGDVLMWATSYDVEEEMAIFKLIVQSDYASTKRRAVFNSSISINETLGTISSNRLSFDDGNNVIVLPTVDQIIHTIKEMPDVTEIKVINGGTDKDLYFRNNQTPTTGFTKVTTPYGNTVKVKPKENIILSKKQNEWRVVGGSYTSTPEFHKVIVDA